MWTSLYWRVNYRKLYKLFYVFIYLFILNDLISEIKMTMSNYLWHLRPTQRYKAKKIQLKFTLFLWLLVCEINEQLYESLCWVWYKDKIIMKRCRLRLLMTVFYFVLNELKMYCQEECYLAKESSDGWRKPQEKF